LKATLARALKGLTSRHAIINTTPLRPLVRLAQACQTKYAALPCTDSAPPRARYLISKVSIVWELDHHLSRKAKDNLVLSRLAADLPEMREWAASRGCTRVLVIDPQLSAVGGRPADQRDGVSGAPEAVPEDAEVPIHFRVLDAFDSVTLVAYPSAVMQRVLLVSNANSSSYTGTALYLEEVAALHKGCLDPARPWPLKTPYRALWVDPREPTFAVIEGGREGAGRGPLGDADAMCKRILDVATGAVEPYPDDASIVERVLSSNEVGLWTDLAFKHGRFVPEREQAQNALAHRLIEDLTGIMKSVETPEQFLEGCRMIRMALALCHWSVSNNIRRLVFRWSKGLLEHELIQRVVRLTVIALKRWPATAAASALDALWGLVYIFGERKVRPDNAFGWRVLEVYPALFGRITTTIFGDPHEYAVCSNPLMRVLLALTYWSASEPTDRDNVLRVLTSSGESLEAARAWIFRDLRQAVHAYQCGKTSPPEISLSLEMLQRMTDLGFQLTVPEARVLIWLVVSAAESDTSLIESLAALLLQVCTALRGAHPPPRRVLLHRGE
jgi:hypothetical protein